MVKPPSLYTVYLTYCDPSIFIRTENKSRKKQLRTLEEIYINLLESEDFLVHFV